MSVNYQTVLMLVTCVITPDTSHDLREVIRPSVRPSDLGGKATNPDCPGLL